METMLFASGERQISKAKVKMGIKNGTKNFALVLFDCEAPGEVLRRLGLIKDDLVLLPSQEKAIAYGIESGELGTVPEEQADRPRAGAGGLRRDPEALTGRTNYHYFGILGKGISV